MQRIPPSTQVRAALTAEFMLQVGLEEQLSGFFGRDQYGRGSTARLAERLRRPDPEARGWSSLSAPQSYGGRRLERPPGARVGPCGLRIKCYLRVRLERWMKGPRIR